MLLNHNEDWDTCAISDYALARVWVSDFTDVDGNFDFILTGEDLSKKLGVNYDRNVTPTDEEYGDMIVKGWNNEEDEVIDKYLNMNLIFDVGTKNGRRGTVVKRSRGIDGRAIGRPHTNHFFETCEYEIEFTYGNQDKYAVNLITDNMYAQVDDEGHKF